MNFRLLRLPYVALNEVLRSMDPFELMHFSKISANAKRIVKRFSNTNRVKFDIDFTIRTIPFVYIGNSLKCEVTSDPSKRDDIFYLDQWEDTILFKYSEDVIEGLKQLVENAMDVLNARLQRVEINVLAFPSKNKAITDWISSISKSVEWLEIGDKENELEAIEYLVNNVIATNVLNIVNEEGNTFRGSIPKLSETFYISNGQWITLERLLQFDCPEIHINKSKLSCADINGYLKAWTESRTHSSVEHIAMYFSDPIWDEILNGLVFEVIDDDVTRILPRANNFTVTVRGGIDVRRDDGKIVTLYTYAHYGVLHLGLSFH